MERDKWIWIGFGFNLDSDSIWLADRNGESRSGSRQAKISPQKGMDGNKKFFFFLSVFAYFSRSFIYIIFQK